MSILKKISSVLLITTIFSSFPVFAATTTPTVNTATKSIEHKDKITDWSYTIYDANGKEKSNGTFSSKETQPKGHVFGFSKTDINLDNGEIIILKPSSGSRGFHCYEGKTMSFSYELSRSATMELTISGYSDHTGRYKQRIDDSPSFYDEYTAPHEDDYYVLIRNFSSDSVTINKFFLYF